MNAFHIAGIVLAGWAVLVTALGLRRDGFPGKGERLVSAVSVLLVLGTILAGVISGAVEAAEEEHKHAKEHKGEAAAGPPAPGTKLELTADPGGQLRFDKRRLQAPAGPVTIVMTNPSALPHNVVLEGNGVEEEGVTVGARGVSTVSAELRPGEYSFYCSVLGHHEGGMEGTLTVR